METHYGRAWRGTREQEEEGRQRWRLIEMNRDLIEGSRGVSLGERRRIKAKGSKDGVRGLRAPSKPRGNKY